MKSVFKYIILGVLCVLLTAGITVQLRVSRTSESASSKERVIDNLKDQIIMLNDENSKLEKKLQNSEENLTKARVAASENDATNKEISDLIKKYNTFSGYTNIYGEGLSIVYTPEKNEDVSDVAKDIRYIVNELRNVGVEAISINGQRMVNNSSIEAVKNKIEVNGENLSAPYIIDVIGDSDMINNGIARPGGIVDYIRLSGAKVIIELKNKVNINKFSTI